MHIYEETLLEKLKLGWRFPQQVLYLHKNALGISLMQPNIILTSLALKLYFGHTCLDGECNRLISVNLEEVMVEYGRNCKFAEIPQEEKTWNKTWDNHVFE